MHAARCVIAEKLRRNSYNISYPVYRGAFYDASTTNLTYIIPSSHHTSQGAEVVLSFLSPITPTSTLRQSIPASYLTIFVTGNLDLDVYVDLNGLWVTGNRGSYITWDLDATGLPDGDHMLKSWSVRRQTEQHFTEFLDRSEWGTLHFTAPRDVRHECGTSADLRQRFAQNGTLENTATVPPQRVMENETVFAFSKSFYANSTSSDAPSQSVRFTIAYLQKPVMQYAAARGMTLMRPLWESYFPRDLELIAFHYYDFHNATALATQYNARLTQDALESGADEYADIVALSARQVMGGTYFSGTPESPLLFVKEISSDGNTQTIDIIYPAFPFFIYTNPRWFAYLLEPLIEHMLSGQYPNKYAMHDLGSHFPNATGHPLGRDEYMPVEECGNILIMGLALVNTLQRKTDESAISAWQSSGDESVHGRADPGIFSLRQGQEDDILYIDEHWAGGTQGIKQARGWVERSYQLWKQWTGYLEEFALRPTSQLSTDDFAGWLALQTNLALKGIIGIRAMQGLAKVANVDADVKIYKNISEYYIEKWEEYGISRDKTHAKVAYDWYGSWATTYNLYADSLLCFHLGSEDEDSKTTLEHGGDQKPMKSGIKDDNLGFVPRHIYQMQSDWYYGVRQKYGLPLDSRHLYTKTDWEFFAMAVAAPRVRAEILQSVARWVNETSIDRPLSDLHKTEGDGGFPGPNFFARPVVGGHFAFLTLKEACNGKAMGGLDFLDDSVVDRYMDHTRHSIELDALLQQEVEEAKTQGLYIEGHLLQTGPH